MSDGITEAERHARTLTDEDFRQAKNPKTRTEEDIKDCILFETKELNIIADLHNALLAFLASDDFEIEFNGKNVFYTILGKLEILIIKRRAVIEFEKELLGNL